MKRSKASKSRQLSPTRSVRSTYEPSSVRGLITNRQQSIKTESQVSQYTQRTNKTNTNTLGSQDFQYIEDEMDKEELKEVFVSEEEEKVIQKILEIARKGKISQKNAFEIPLKVLDNEKFSTGKGKFWKFASQLLETSMSIYEKRIQNTWINTNIIHDKLARMTFDTKKSYENDDEQGPQKQKSSQYLLHSLEEFRDPKIFDNVRLGFETLETAEKINIPKIKQNLSDDPLFHRKIKAFDSNSLKGLLLNVFDLTSACQIELFSDENRLLQKDTGKMKKNQYYPPSQQQFFKKTMLESAKLKNTTNVFNKVSDIKNTITNFNKTAIAETSPEDEIAMPQFENFLQDQMPFLQSQVSLYDGDFLHQQESNDMKPLTQEDQRTENSELVMQSQSINAYSQNSPIDFYSESPFGSADHDRSFHSVMTPWEMEFKEGKLRKKSKKRQTKNKKEGKKRQKIQQAVIDFDAYKVQNRKITLNKAKNSSVKSSPRKKTHNFSNLLPPQLAVYQKINYKRFSTVSTVSHKAAITQKDNSPSKQPEQNFPDFLAPDPSMLDINIQTLLQKDSDQHNNQPDPYISSSPHPLSSLAVPLPLVPHRYNIRETKKQIFQRVKDQREIRISEITQSHDLQFVGLTPSSIFVTFLHLANQKNMTVRNSRDEADVILSWQ